MRLAEFISMSLGGELYWGFLLRFLFEGPKGLGSVEKPDSNVDLDIYEFKADI